MRVATRKGGKRTNQINSRWKLIGLHIKSQHSNCICHHRKNFFNSVVSTQGARCLLADIKHFYLKNILPDPESMRIPLKIIPQEIIDAYNLTALVYNQGWIHMRIEKGMYGLKQARIISNR